MKEKMAKLAHEFINNNKLKQIDYISLENAASDMGYDVIEFGSAYNDENVETVIRNLGLAEFTAKSRGFTYVDDKYRLIFICGALNEEEKLMVMAHELGHIACEHLNQGKILGKDVREEYEANEFAHYLMHRNLKNKWDEFFARHKKEAVVTAIALLLIAVFSVATVLFVKDSSYMEDWYVTPTGSKYHEKDCIFIKDKKSVKRLEKEAFETGDYEPCHMCLPK